MEVNGEKGKPSKQELEQNLCEQNVSVLSPSSSTIHKHKEALWHLPVSFPLFFCLFLAVFNTYLSDDPKQKVETVTSELQM